MCKPMKWPESVEKAKPPPTEGRTGVAQRQERDSPTVEPSTLRNGRAKPKSRQAAAKTEYWVIRRSSKSAKVSREVVNHTQGYLAHNRRLLWQDLHRD